ncbi:alpha/beta fold hydrolase [Camelimonas abortus]|uniref:Alpha/beta fold hydrolase n=1 Tax=Camelimonas abortus TaxID=1017184 RepID=A0ABV7LCI8_9HYPH
MPLIETRRHRFNVVIDGPGDAPPLLMAHPLGASLEVWTPQVARLARRFRVIRYDARGHGDTPVPADAAGEAGREGVGALGQDALDVMDALGLARVHWCGLSMGGMAGQWLLANAPHRLDRVVLSNTAATTGPAEAWTERLAVLKSEGMAGLIDGVMARWFTPAFAAAHPDRVETVRRLVLRTSPEGYAACAMALRGMDLRQAIAGATPPTLVIAGAHDAGTTPEQAQFIASQLANARLLTLDAAHLSNVEQAGPFTEAVAEFLLGTD